MIRKTLNAHRIEAVCIVADCAVAVAALFHMEFDQVPMEKVGISAALGAGAIAVWKRWRHNDGHGGHS